MLVVVYHKLYIPSLPTTYGQIGMAYNMYRKMYITLYLCITSDSCNFKAKADAQSVF